MQILVAAPTSYVWTCDLCYSSLFFSQTLHIFTNKHVEMQLCDCLWRYNISWNKVFKSLMYLGSCPDHVLVSRDFHFRLCRYQWKIIQVETLSGVVRRCAGVCMCFFDRTYPPGPRLWLAARTHVYRALKALRWTRTTRLVATSEASTCSLIRHFFFLMTRQTKKQWNTIAWWQLLIASVSPEYPQNGNRWKKHEKWQRTELEIPSALVGRCHSFLRRS